jgi:hypothetical protein
VNRTDLTERSDGTAGAQFRIGGVRRAKAEGFGVWFRILLRSLRRDSPAGGDRESRLGVGESDGSDGADGWWGVGKWDRTEPTDYANGASDRSDGLDRS